MKTKNKAPEFGSNGAVINSDLISTELASEYERSEASDRRKIAPKLWPASALTLVVLGVFLLGMRYAIGDHSQEAFLLNWSPMLLVVAGTFWRDIWNRYIHRE